MTDSSSSTNDKIVAGLTEELEGFNEFKALLLTEQEALIQGDTSALTEVTEAKDSRIQKLNLLTTYRSKLVSSLGFAESKDGFSEWIRQSPVEISTLWSSLIKLAKEIQHLNEVNGKLINTRLQYTQQSLSALLAAVNQANLYGPDGQQNTVPQTSNVRGIIGKA